MMGLAVWLDGGGGNGLVPRGAEEKKASEAAATAAAADTEGVEWEKPSSKCGSAPFLG
jgi:hypothetical protein